MAEDLYDVNPKYGGKVTGGRWARYEDTLIHVISRVRQRYQCKVSIADVNGWNRKIINGDDSVLWFTDNDDMTTEYIVNHQGKRIILLFDVRRWTIVTALPNHRLKRKISA